MPTWGWIVIGIAAAVALVAAAWGTMRAARTRRLKSTFGPEYDRTIADAPTRGEAEEVLEERRRRHEEFELRPLTPAARDRYLQSWRDAQARFVDDPGSAIEEADRLIQSVMAERGYPVDDFEERAGDLSVDYPDIVENYREAHGVAEAHARGHADTEDLRRAMTRYRSLFERLLETEEEPARS